MTLQAGSRLAAYEITGSIGAGGTGDVFRARDTRLCPDVAIEVLPELFTRDPDPSTSTGRPEQRRGAVGSRGSSARRTRASRSTGVNLWRRGSGFAIAPHDLLARAEVGTIFCPAV